MSWDDRIQEAKARGGFTEEDKQLSGSWDTCLMSENPIFRGLKPAEGVALSRAVEADDVDRAEGIARDIEEHAEQIAAASEARERDEDWIRWSD